jgi:manganese transport protein
LSLQLPFAVVPLVMFTASRRKMGPFVAPRWLTVFASLIAASIIVLNAKLVWDYLGG